MFIVTITFDDNEKSIRRFNDYSKARDCYCEYDELKSSGDRSISDVELEEVTK